MLESKHSKIWQIFEFKGRQLGQFWSDWFHCRTNPSSCGHIHFDYVWWWLVNTSVDARVLTSKLWTDGHQTDGHRQTDWHRQTVSDHNSSLSTPCSCELKKKWEKKKFIVMSYLLVHNVFLPCRSRSMIFLSTSATSTACFKVNSSSYNNVLSIIFNVP